MSQIKRYLEDIIEEAIDIQNIHGSSAEAALFEVAQTRSIPVEDIPAWIASILPYMPQSV